MDTIKIIDAHTHIQFPEFDKDRENTIKRAIDNGIAMISAGADLESTEKGIEVSNSYDFIWTSAGIHPHEATKTTSEDLKKLEMFAENKNVVGIGECGLDYSRLENDEEKEAQKELFEKHIEISNKTKKPLIIHCRDAFDDTFNILKENKNIIDANNPGILHFFTGTKDIAKQFIDLGFSFTFGGLITKTCEFDDILKYIPEDRLLVETDAPYVAPLKYKGHRNEPSYIIETIKQLSKIRGENIEHIENTTKNNAIRIFNL